jgi:hypothetical protein
MAKTSAELLAFPSAGLSAAILDAALTLQSLDGESALAWWRSRARRHANELAACGLPETRVSLEVMSFQRSVFSKLGEIAYSKGD